MTPEQLKAQLARLGLTQTRAAIILGVSSRTMRRWVAGKARIPEAAAQLLRLYEEAPEANHQH